MICIYIGELCMYTSCIRRQVYRKCFIEASIVFFEFLVFLLGSLMAAVIQLVNPVWAIMWLVSFDVADDSSFGQCCSTWPS